jgi:putative flippase GtrA
VRAAVVYLAVQVAAYGLDFGTFFALYRFDLLDPVPANVAGKFVAAVFAFLMHRNLTFWQASGARLLPQAVRYVALLLFNAAASSLLLAVLADRLLSPSAAKLFADFIMVALSFGMSKALVFRGDTGAGA